MVGLFGFTMKESLFFHRLRNWEYWPVWIVYFPSFFQYLYYAFRSRSWVFFTVANPGIVNGGAFLVPKDKIYNQLPKNQYPKTLVIAPTVSPTIVTNWLKKENLSYPILLKPNHGLRGLGLSIIRDEEKLIKFLSEIRAEYLVQEFVKGKEEMGVFFVRHPGTKKVRLTSIVRKGFMQILGDGKSTVEALLQATPRYAMQMDVLRKDPSIEMDKVLEKEEILALPKIGNHSLGAIFLDGKAWNTPELLSTVTEILEVLPGVNYGRLDIKFDHFEAMVSEGEFKIIELNGAFSEPAHIYDPQYSILEAWKVLREHFGYLFEVCSYQMSVGIRPMGLWEGLRLIREHFRETGRF